jgi:VanZ family protein
MSWLHWLPAVGFAALIFSFSHQSDPPGAALGPDYVLHALAYGVFGLTLVWGMTSGIQSRLTPRGALTCWVIATVYGTLDEFHQSFIPARSATWSDVAADSIGAGLAIGAAYLVLRAVETE